MHRSLLFAAIAALLAGASAGAAESPALTIYRADSDALFENSASPVTEGYAVVHESRALKLGERLFTSKPRAFRRSLQRRWRGGQ